MTTAVEKIVDEVRALPRSDLDEFLSWLADYELQQADDWDREMERDSQPGGRLQSVIDRALRRHCRRQDEYERLIGTWNA